MGMRLGLGYFWWRCRGNCFVWAVAVSSCVHYFGANEKFFWLPSDLTSQSSWPLYLAHSLPCFGLDVSFWTAWLSRCAHLWFVWDWSGQLTQILTWASLLDCIPACVDWLDSEFLHCSVGTSPSARAKTSRGNFHWPSSPPLTTCSPSRNIHWPMHLPLRFCIDLVLTDCCQVKALASICFCSSWFGQLNFFWKL